MTNGEISFNPTIIARNDIMLTQKKIPLQNT